MQRVRDAERERIFNEYKSRKGELVSGVVRRFERGSDCTSATVVMIRIAENRVDY